MTTRSRCATALACVCLLLPAAVGGDTYPDTSVRITIHVVALDGGDPSPTHYRLLTRDGAQSNLHTGLRVPIPTTRFGVDGEGPVTSFTYQRVGFSASLRADVLDANRVRVSGSIEHSRIELERSTAAAGASPVIRTTSQDIEAVVTVGESLRALTIEDASGAEHTIEIEVDLLPGSRDPAAASVSRDRAATTRT